jgi:integrase
LPRSQPTATSIRNTTRRSSFRAPLPHLRYELRHLGGARLPAALIDTSPCILGKNELGTISDKDTDWRSTAKFDRDEYESLISDVRVPQDRRVLYGLLGLGMLRHGEAAGLRWKNVQVEHRPLGRLVIATSYNLGRTKTRRDRWMPIHPALAALLAEWKLSGWVREFGRLPGPDDLVVPHTQPTNRGPRVQFGGMRSDHDSYKRLRLDCTALVLRHRRIHDLRRTGITLAREDGAQKDTLRASTHGGAMDIMDVYTSMGWPALCAEVAKILVRRREQLVL